MPRRTGMNFFFASCARMTSLETWSEPTESGEIRTMTAWQRSISWSICSRYDAPTAPLSS